MNAPGSGTLPNLASDKLSLCQVIWDLEDLPVQEDGVRDGSHPSLAPDPVEPADVEMATEELGNIPIVDAYHVAMLASPELVQRDRFSVESIQYDGYCDEFVVMNFCG